LTSCRQRSHVVTRATVLERYNERAYWTPSVVKEVFRAVRRRRSVLAAGPGVASPKSRLLGLGGHAGLEVVVPICPPGSAFAASASSTS
jgi:hypothetical protein